MEGWKDGNGHGSDLMSLRILITGGTFDKHYDAIRGELTFSESHLPAMLRQARITLPIVTEVCLLKDSLQMNEEDREKVLQACRSAPERQVVVVHGTDTMATTAQVVGRAGLRDKTIVFTGAMIPFSVSGSDALFNLGCAVTACQLMPPEVYVTMNGKVWRWDGVRKNRIEGFFENMDA
jgi:L-asparaginase